MVMLGANTINSESLHARIGCRKYLPFLGSACALERDCVHIKMLQYSDPIAHILRIANGDGLDMSIL